MERLSLHDLPQSGPDEVNAQDHPVMAAVVTGEIPPPSQGPPQLLAQMFTTASQLLDLTDKKLVVVLRDGRKLIGVLRSWDQYANLMLQDTVERIMVHEHYADIVRGIYLVRGENVLLLGEIDLDKEDDIPEPFKVAPVEVVISLQKEEQQERERKDKGRRRKLQDLGFEGENDGEIVL